MKLLNFTRNEGLNAIWSKDQGSSLVEAEPWAVTSTQVLPFGYFKTLLPLW